MIQRAAVLLGLLGVAGLLVTVAPGGSGYVSEAGVPGTAYSWLYRAAVLAIAATAALLAVVLPVLWVRLPLAAAVPAIAVSGTVTCTAGCPLPPYEPTTPADLIHAGGSILGVGLCALAMLAAARWESGRTRSVSLIAVAVGWPLLAATAIGIAAAGRGAFTGAVERLSLAVCLLWLIAVAVLALPHRPEDDRAAGARADRRQPGQS